MLIIRRLQKGEIKVRATRKGRASFVLEDGLIKVDKLVIDSPGEYEKDRVFIESPAKGIYIASLAGHVLFIVAPGTELKNKYLEEVEEVDVLLINKEEDKLVNMVEPCLVIPLTKLQEGQKVKVTASKLSGEETNIWEPSKN